VQYRILIFMSRIICFLPYSWLMGFGKILGILYYKFIQKQRNRALRQIKMSLKISDEAARRLVRASFINLGRNFLEILYMPHLSQTNFREYIDIENIDRLQAALAEKHGVVVLTAHIGNWEWLAVGLGFSGLPVAAIAKPQPNQQYTRALNHFRGTTGAEIFSRGTSELMAAARALKQGKMLGFLADQDAGPGGAFIEFLGRTASTPMGPAVFAKKFNSPVVPVFILRQPDGHHKIVIGEIMRYEDHGDADKDLFEFTVRMTKIVDTFIRKNPTQWLWFQKRWNTPPNERKEKHHTVKAQVEEE
jgi:Kdo2-lipid IVA lauroyltransferase/acyltransferase